MSGVTPDEVRRTRFGRAPFGQRGYDVAAVDAFRERVAQAFLGRTTLTAAQIRDHEFPTAARGHRGYDRDEVDDFLDRACVALEFARRGLTPRSPGALLAPEDVRALRFSPPHPNRPGYAADEVDVFLDHVTTTLTHTGPASLTSRELDSVRFGLAHPGSAAYGIEEVDSFVDVVARTLRAEEATAR
ncbi:DivIVA domain-containing protein [Nocardia sp. NPDC004068]|uniref:DivIVA domain-containing protein n=1 Tax=Nocardia sp. NPDC004068 TaxID=3364303 RepID=UPI0036A85512